MERVESCRASEGGRVRWLGQPSGRSQGSWTWAKDEGDPSAVSGRSLCLTDSQVRLIHHLHFDIRLTVPIDFITDAKLDMPS